MNDNNNNMFNINNISKKVGETSVCLLLICSLSLAPVASITTTTTTTSKANQQIEASLKLLEEKESALRDREASIIARESALHHLEAAANRKLASISELDASIQERMSVTMSSVASMCRSSSNQYMQAQAGPMMWNLALPTNLASEQRAPIQLASPPAPPLPSSPGPASPPPPPPSVALSPSPSGRSSPPPPPPKSASGALSRSSSSGNKSPTNAQSASANLAQELKARLSELNAKKARERESSDDEIDGDEVLARLSKRNQK